MACIGTGECNGSFGELLQGVLPGTRKFLVNLKIRNRSRVRVELSPCAYSEEKEEEYARSYRSFSKSYKALRNVLIDLGRHEDSHIAVESDIPVGKGLSSSTADMVATIRATTQALSIAVKPDYVSRVLTEIEPNDGLHHSGTAAYHHTTGKLIFRVDWVPPFDILGIDFGGVVDTVKFNAQPTSWSDEEMAGYEALLEKMRAALEGRDLAGVAAVATESARRWQRIHPKPQLDAVLALAGQVGALGVANAHSGTFLGLLFPRGGANRAAVEAAAAAAFPDHPPHWFETVDAAA